MWRGGSGPDKCVGRSGGQARTWRTTSGGGRGKKGWRAREGKGLKEGEGEADRGIGLRDGGRTLKAGK